MATDLDLFDLSRLTADDRAVYDAACAAIRAVEDEIAGHPTQPLTPEVQAAAAAVWQRIANRLNHDNPTQP